MKSISTICVILLTSAISFGQQLRSIDALATSPKSAPTADATMAVARKFAKPGTRIQFEPRLGVPTFLFAGAKPVSNELSRFSERVEVSAARSHLKDLRDAYRLNPSDVDDAIITDIHNTGRGAIIVRMARTVGGIDVFRDRLTVVMDRNLDLIAVAGYFPGSSIGIKGSYRLLPESGVAAAVADRTGSPVDAAALTKSDAAGGYSLYSIPSRTADSLALTVSSPIRSKQILFHLPDELVPAYYVEVPAAADLYAYVISGVDGSILYRHTLTASESFTYRAWADSTAPYIPFDGPQGTSVTPHPTGMPDGFDPPFVPPGLLSLQNSPFSFNDPWLLPGATETVGNNVDAYLDIASPDGFQPDLGEFRAATNGPNTFDYTYDPLAAPNSTNQRMASLVQMFFVTNLLHDWFYDSGFNEAAGNAQLNNFGRGGIGNDSMRVEGQDFGGRDNANMSTPADGGRPRMQMYLWQGKTDAHVQVNSPMDISGEYPSGAASFGPTSFDLTNDVVLVNDGSSTPTLGCRSRYTNAAAVSGKIALVDRGTCNFTDKATYAQRNGAVGLIIANNVPGGPVAMGADRTVRISIPVLSVSQDDGALIKARLASTTVNATLFRQLTPDIDGGIDNQVVAHEWGHYLSTRLIGGFGNQVGNGMGEGWSDVVAMLMTVRAEDTSNPTNTNWQGAYSISGYANSVIDNNYYFGIRRVPYSTDFSKDPLTFRHIVDGEVLPDVPMVSFGVGNSEVHNTGEVWATMLWECYAALLRDTQGATPRLTFLEARQRMKDYLVASLKATPTDPTFLDGRDALLSVAFANDPADGALFAQAFARRGAGFGAVAPDRYSTTNSPGLVESFDVGNSVRFDHALLSDTPGSCDPDGSLDVGETGKLTVYFENNGYGALTHTSVHVTSTNSNVAFPSGNTISNISSSPFQIVSVDVPVALVGGSGIQQLDFTITLDDVDLTVPASPAIFTGPANFDLVASTTETVEAPLSSLPWTLAAEPASASWTRNEISLTDHRWHGPDSAYPSVTALVSPVLNVGGGNFSFSFTHRFGFEASQGTNFDGGVLEISTDGNTWTDIGSFLSNPGYNGTIVSTSGNPLGGRQAFVKDRSFRTSTVNLGNAYANQAVQIRFVVGTDEAVGGFGWEIDNISFTGITNAPFYQVVPDAMSCP